MSEYYDVIKQCIAELYSLSLWHAIHVVRNILVGPVWSFRACACVAFSGLLLDKIGVKCEKILCSSKTSLKHRHCVKTNNSKTKYMLLQVRYWWRHVFADAALLFTSGTLLGNVLFAVSSMAPVKHTAAMFPVMLLGRGVILGISDFPTRSA